MSTHVTSHNPVRSDLRDLEPPSATTPTRPAGRRWALAGLGAALASIGGTVAAFSLTAVYDPELAGDAEAIAADLADGVVAMIALHVLLCTAAVLLAVFGVGLHRRLRATMPEGHLAPALAAFGPLGTSVVLVLATALDTEFIWATGPNSALPEVMAVYGHWVNTVPGCWVLMGITGLALFSAARAGAVARWVGWVGLVLGGLSLLTGISPLQYLAGFTGSLMLLVVSIGFLAGDRAHRARTA